MHEHFDEGYTKGKLKDDLFTIWFLWVYRQLDKFQREDDQATIMQETAGAIEDILTRKASIGPIVHTYTPVGLMSVEPNRQSWWQRIFSEQTDPTRRDIDHRIEKMIALEGLAVDQYIRFGKWMEKLQQAHTAVGKTGKDDPHRFFINVLDEAVQQLAEVGADSTLPINVFPLSVYQSALEGYTDKERSDIVAALRTTTLYKNFTKLLDRKYESIRL
ncbi:MAG: hypothetical protein BWK78_05900 [Thiotrichaceae bacterium IS1]|nr:MAG: hypothetical protein BWK78_05900 [Thiotrichaceae bacterium IS1]